MLHKIRPARIPQRKSSPPGVSPSPRPMSRPNALVAASQSDKCKACEASRRCLPAAARNGISQAVRGWKNSNSKLPASRAARAEKICRSRTESSSSEREEDNLRFTEAAFHMEKQHLWPTCITSEEMETQSLV